MILKENVNEYVNKIRENEDIIKDTIFKYLGIKLKLELKITEAFPQYFVDFIEDGKITTEILTNNKFLKQLFSEGRIRIDCLYDGKLDIGIFIVVIFFEHGFYFQRNFTKLLLFNIDFKTNQVRVETDSRPVSLTCEKNAVKSIKKVYEKIITLDSFDYPDEYIYAGHSIICDKEKKIFKPMPIKDGKYDKIPKGYEYFGFIPFTIHKEEEYIFVVLEGELRQELLQYKD